MGSEKNNALIERDGPVSSGNAIGLRTIVARVTLGLWLVTAGGTGALLWSFSRYDSDYWIALWILVIGLTGYLFSMFLFKLTRSVLDRRRMVRWGAIASGILVVTLGQAAVDHLLWDYFMRASHPRFRSDWATGIGFNIMMYIWLFASYVATLLLIFATQSATERERQIALGEDLARKAAFQKSRYQMSPDFLSSTFRNVWRLLDEGNRPEAEAIVQRFASYLRWVLSTPPDGRAAAGDEIAAVESAVAVSGMAKTLLLVDCPQASLETRIPAFLLQALLECLPDDGTPGQQRSIKLEVAKAETRISMTCAPCVQEPSSARSARLDDLRRTFASEGVVIEERGPCSLMAIVPSTGT